MSWGWRRVCRNVTVLARGGLAVALALWPVAAAQAQGPFYAGKTLTVLVGFEAGGTVDVFVRSFAPYLGKEIEGQPVVVVQNMPGAGSLVATAYIHEKAKPDGQTISFGSWDPLAQALGSPNLRVRYDELHLVGAISDVRINYARTAVIAGGLKKPADIVKAQGITVGALTSTSVSTLMGHLALKLLGVEHRFVAGYRGGNDVFLAIQRGEVDVHNTSIGTFRSRGAQFIASGAVIGLHYFVPVDGQGRYERIPAIGEMPAFPDLYQEIHGRMPSGPDWEALNWLVQQFGVLAFVGLAHADTPPVALAALREGVMRAGNDPGFRDEATKKFGFPYGFVNVASGQALFASLKDVSPDIVATLRATIAATSK